MKKDNTVLAGVMLGLSVGLLLLGLRFMGINTGFVVPLCLGILVVILDGICLRPILNNYRNKQLAEKGITVDGEILEIVNSAIHPKYYVDDGFGNPVLPADVSNIPVAYTLRIKYCAEGTVYTKEVITPAKTPMEIFPFRIVQGASIPIKYLKKVPEWFMVAIPAITEGTVQAQRSLLYKGPFAAFVITTIYVVYLVTHVL